MTEIYPIDFTWKAREVKDGATIDFTVKLSDDQPGELLYHLMVVQTLNGVKSVVWNRSYLRRVQAFAAARKLMHDQETRLRPVYHKKGVKE